MFKGCGCGYNMNHADCDDANASLSGNVADAYIPAYTAYYSIVNTAVAFLWNQSGGSVNVHSSDVSSGSSAVTAACGWYVAGTWRDTSANYDTGLDYGYMIYYSGENFLGAAEGSSSSSC